MSPILEGLKGKLVVSCQAFPGDPLDNTDALRRIALAAISGGAAGLRINSAEHVTAIRRDTQLPIIGIEKRDGPAGMRITPDFASAAVLAAAGASLIALDCTDRIWPDGDPWPALIDRIHRELHLPVLADIATFEEGLAAAGAGADFVGTTLNGYTDRTRGTRTFSWTLLAQLTKALQVPIIAEGHLSTPEDARRAIDGGAWSVIIGSAITRPGVIASRFAGALARPVATAPAIGVDIGGTSVKAALIRRTGEVSNTVQVPTDAGHGRETIAAALVEAIEPVLAAAQYECSAPAGLGVATAGAVNQRDGSIFAATENLPGWTGFPLRSFVEERFHLPAFAVNDAQAAALSELHFGTGKGLSDFFALTIGTGIGGGFVSGGKLVRGEHGFAGSIGHMVIRTGGLPCNCGRTGCLEAYVSTAALLREYRQHGGDLQPKPVDDAALALQINRLARRGDLAARKAYAALADYLAEAIANLFNVLDPQAVFLAGGLIEDYDEFVPAVEQRVTEFLHFGVERRPQVRRAAAGRLAGIQGAAALVFEAGCAGGLQSGASK